MLVRHEHALATQVYTHGINGRSNKGGEEADEDKQVSRVHDVRGTEKERERLRKRARGMENIGNE